MLKIRESAHMHERNEKDAIDRDCGSTKCLSIDCEYLVVDLTKSRTQSAIRFVIAIEKSQLNFQTLIHIHIFF